MDDDRLIEVRVTDATGFEPWSLQATSLTTFEWRKTYIQVVDYNEDGTLNPDTREVLRLRSKKGNTLFACKPEDDDEPDEFPGTYWREM